jgi:integrase
MKLTQRRIETLECPAERRDMMVFDDDQPGLGVRVTAGGGRSFLAQYTLAGAKRRIPLGSCSAISLAKAREAVRAILGDVAKGRDPAGERKEAAAETKRKAAHLALSLDTLLKQWESIHLADKRQSYAAEAVRAVRFSFEKQLQAPAADLDRIAVVRVLDTLAKQGKAAMAARTAAYGRACYQWAVKRGSITNNPFSNLPLAAVEKRERVLTDDELRAVWFSTGDAGAFNLIVRMLILTGQRRAEVAEMTWDEISPDLTTWTIAADRAKNKTAHVVPLPPRVQAILAAVTRRKNVDPKSNQPEFVFPGQSGRFNGFGKSKAALDKSSGVGDWRLHDLRRTMATGLQKLGVRLEVTEKLLNHISGSQAGIVGVYQRHDFATEKKAALEAWGELVAAIVEKRAAVGNVTPLKTAKV